MAAADRAEIEELIRSTGFFRAKARNIQAMAGDLAEHHGGELPRDLETLTELAGVGRKTANVVLGTAFGIASGVVVDTHVKRLAYRLGLTTHKEPVQDRARPDRRRPPIRVGRPEPSSDPPRPPGLPGPQAPLRRVRPRDRSARRTACRPPADSPMSSAAVATGRPFDVPQQEVSRSAPPLEYLCTCSSARSAARLTGARRPRTCTSSTSSRHIPPPSASSSSRPRPTGPRPSSSRTSPSCRPCSPSFVSVTYGAGGSTRERTHDLIVRIQRETEPDGGLAPDLRLPQPGRAGGDPRSLRRRRASRTSWRWAATLPRTWPATTAPATPSSTPNSSCSFLRSRTNVPDPRGFGIGVAGFPEGHPGTPNRLQELDYLKRKVDAGADYICTQLFFSNPTSTTSASGASWRASGCRSSPGSCPSRRRRTWSGWPSSRSGPGSRPGSCGPSTGAATTRRPSPRWASTGPPSSAATCWTTRCGASTSTRSTARTRPGKIYENLGVKDSNSLQKRPPS